MPKHNISVIGLGFVGLSLAVLNARRGYRTTGADTNKEKIDNLKAGKIDFFEPQLDDILNNNTTKENIHLTSDIGHAVRNSEIIFLTVGTSLKDNPLDVDLSHIRKAASQIYVSLKDDKNYRTLVVKSTVSPLTIKNTIMPIFQDLIKEKKISIIMNPEFLREGSAINDLLQPHMIVIGSDSRHDSQLLEEYYRDFYDNPPEIIHTNITTAELIKYSCNAFLATKISFINTIGLICQELPGLDVNTISYAMGKDPRIGPSYLQAGPGFGGSCLPKDLSDLIRFSQGVGVRPNLLRAVQDVNDVQFETILDMMAHQNILKKDNTIAILGLAFKGNTDDIRGSIAIKVVKALLRHNLRINVHDPMAINNFKQIFGTEISYFSTVHECLRGTDCCIILTDWNEYRCLKPHDFQNGMRTVNIIDTKRMLDAKEFEGTRFMATGLGR